MQLRGRENYRGRNIDTVSLPFSLLINWCLPGTEFSVTQRVCSAE